MLGGGFAEVVVGGCCFCAEDTLSTMEFIGLLGVDVRRVDA